MTPINSHDFEALLSGPLPVLVDFFANWCGPCRALAPVLDALSEQFEGRAAVVKVDVDAEPELAARFGVRALPTLLLFANGKVVQQFVGLTSEKVLAQAIEGTSLGVAA